MGHATSLTPGWPRRALHILLNTDSVMLVAISNHSDSPADIVRMRRYEEHDEERCSQTPVCGNVGARDGPTGEIRHEGGHERLSCNEISR